ncbi:hypothetical protein PIB30_084786 [Stylosanthes scabra]|uniref:Uncharacterized protein n=1 Tax=Stylosanthes scabra TaxID=79078 RepID=A0ABU6ST74_9FABA|nr:hypothetical protein [Stylosanthes scabra]
MGEEEGGWRSKGGADDGGAYSSDSDWGIERVEPVHMRVGGRGGGGYDVGAATFCSWQNRQYTQEIATSEDVGSSSSQNSAIGRGSMSYSLKSGSSCSGINLQGCNLTG